LQFTSDGLPVVGVEAQCAGIPCVFSEDITNEAISCDSVEMLPLSVGAEKWADKVLDVKGKSNNRERQSTQASCLWDINYEAKKLCMSYVGLIDWDEVDS